MKLDQLVKAIQRQKIQERNARPDRFVQYDTFEQYFPELYPKEMSPVRFQQEAVQTRFAAMDIMSGKRLDDETMRALFGADNAALDRALAEADPVIKPIPEKLVLMTFDDSTLDHYKIVCPVLEKYGGKANLFTTEMRTNLMPGGTTFEDKTTHMTWEQIKELSDRGHEICNHSWHHDCSFVTSPLELMREEILGIEERCKEYGIPKPIAFGYPQGPGTVEAAALLRELGYRWGRGDLQGASPEKKGHTLYDPRVDSPMFVPSYMVFSLDQIRQRLDETASGMVFQMVFHDVEHDPFVDVPFEEQVECIYEHGGRCITYRELEEYIDPDKAYQYTMG